eukprot:GEMP01063598.1.p1 GENE.GEMP01063598.1~~GEMP01063598.1.p1  ORF type:complete len:333 (+),score=54.06 GEMP01063598.1:68-1066(+)
MNPPKQARFSRRRVTKMRTADFDYFRLKGWRFSSFLQGNYQRILHWSFDQQMEDRITLQFKATVSFSLDNVPHHVEGNWQTSKKKSQRDAAERALFHFETLDEVYVPPSNEGPIATLAKSDPNANYTVEELDGLHRTTVQVMISSTPHYFRGAWQPTSEQSNEDVAMRTLAYLRVSPYRDEFEAPEVEATQQTSFDMKIPADANYASRVAQQKTALMTVQNLLQKVYSKGIQPGQDMWEWMWETDLNGRSRVTVQVPVAGRSFAGHWCSGKKEAQRTTCDELKQFLEARLQEKTENEAAEAYTSGYSPSALYGSAQHGHAHGSKRSSQRRHN